MTLHRLKIIFKVEMVAEVSELGELGVKTLTVHVKEQSCMGIFCCRDSERGGGDAVSFE